MKKLFIAVFAMLLILTACTAAGTTIEETALPPTEVALEAAATATAEPTAEPTATDEPTVEPTATTAPEPTETAEPTATTVPPQEETRSDYEGTIPDDIELPEGAVIIYGHYGGFAGFNNNWVFYEDGRVTLNGADQTQLTPERIQTLVDDLAALGFFETQHLTKPGEFCCDFFDYTLAVQSGDRQNFISYSDGNLNLPGNITAMNVLMFDITNEAQVR